MNSKNLQEMDNPSDIDASTLPAKDLLQVKNVALVILSTLAVIFALDWAQNFVITMLLGILLAYTLNPVVEWLEYI